MRIGFDTRFWVVVNPTPESTIYDILFLTCLDNLKHYMVGSGEEMPSHREMTIWTDDAEAKADAEERLARQKGGQQCVKT